MKILIVGESVDSLLLAKYINIQNTEYDIYITQKQEEHYDYCTVIAIKESDVNGLVSFVKYNQIEFTIVLSELAIINGIADEFQKEGFSILAPASQSSRITYFNSIAKKIMYKLKIPTSRFGIFDRENLAIDYIRGIKFPIVIENDFVLIERCSNKFETFSKAKIGVQKLFEAGNEKIVIENFQDGKIVYLYFITDGYNAFPLINIERDEQEEYVLTNSFSDKLSEDMIVKILQTVIYPLLDDIAKYSQPYIGILGLKLKINKSLFWVYEFYNNFQNYDFVVFMTLLNENIFHLFYDTANGSLADNRNYVELNDKYSYSLSIDKNLVHNILIEEEGLYIAEDDKNVIYTLLKPTLNSAEKEMIEIMEKVIDNDVYNKIKNKYQKKELEI